VSGTVSRPTALELFGVRYERVVELQAFDEQGARDKSRVDEPTGGAVPLLNGQSRYAAGSWKNCDLRGGNSPVTTHSPMPWLSRRGHH
jgi:hypothetical protein